MRSRKSVVAVRRCGRLTAVALVMTSAFTACRGVDDSSHTRPAVLAVGAALDSCRGSANSVRWSGTVRAFPMFSLFIPDSARVTTENGAGRSVSLAWPGCPKCAFGITVFPDSGIGLETRIARMVAEQRRIDSVNRDPAAPIKEFDLMDAPPKPITTPAGRGYLIANDCGDCASQTLLLHRPGYIAEVGLGADDDAPDLPRHMCEMIVVGKTFAWR